MDDAPVTRPELKAELNALEQRIDDRMQAMEARLLTKMQEQEEHMIEQMRDMQTEIIRVFMQFQQRNETRDSAQEKVSAALNERMASVEHRLLQIEAKLLLEPPAA